MKSSALTFLSSLSIVPAMVIAFGISQAFGFNIKKEIYGLLRGQEAIVDQVFVYAENLLTRTRSDLIAGIGLMVLFYAVMRLLHNIEDIFNSVWDIRRHRSIQRKFADYTSLLLISPVLVFISSSLNVFLTTQIRSLLMEWGLSYISGLLTILVRFLPLTLLWLLLSLLYTIMPNTRVRLRSAAFAAVVAGTAFQLTQAAYINFQLGVSSYNAIYGSLAALPLFLVWMQISWMITLFGAELAFAHQNIQNYTYLYDRPLSQREKKYVALIVMSSLCKAFRIGEQSTYSSLSQSTQIPRGLIVRILADLQAAHLVCELLTDKNESRYQPALDIHRITPRLVIDRLETTGFTGMSMNQQGEAALRLRMILTANEEQMDSLLVDI